MKKNLSFLIFLIIISFQLKASEVKIEPIYSIERTQRQLPAPAKVVTNTYVGARALYGVPLISAELEIAQAFRTEDFPSLSQKVDYNTQRAMLGFRSYPLKTEIIGFYLRGGVRARKEVRTTTENGTPTVDDSGVQIDPYAGVGLSINLGENFSLNAGSTLVYNKNADEDHRFDSVNTLSFTIKAKNK